MSESLICTRGSLVILGNVVPFAWRGSRGSWQEVCRPCYRIETPLDFRLASLTVLAHPVARHVLTVAPAPHILQHLYLPSTSTSWPRSQPQFLAAWYRPPALLPVRRQRHHLQPVYL